MTVIVAVPAGGSVPRSQVTRPPGSPIEQLPALLATVAVDSTISLGS